MAWRGKHIHGKESEGMLSFILVLQEEDIRHQAKWASVRETE